jgi:hypothetical protein
MKTASAIAVPLFRLESIDKSTGFYKGQRMMTAPQTINPTALRGMANRLAMDYIKARVKTLK